MAQPAELLHAELLHTICSSPEVTVLTEKSSFTDSDTVGAVKEASVCIVTCTHTVGAYEFLQRCEQPVHPLRWSPMLGSSSGHPQARQHGHLYSWSGDWDANPFPAGGMGKKAMFVCKNHLHTGT